MVITVHWRVWTKVTMVPVDLMTPTMLLRAWMMTMEPSMFLTMIMRLRRVWMMITTNPMVLADMRLLMMPLERTRLTVIKLEKARLSMTSVVDCSSERQHVSQVTS